MIGRTIDAFLLFSCKLVRHQVVLHHFKDLHFLFFHLEFLLLFDLFKVIELLLQVALVFYHFLSFHLLLVLSVIHDLGNDGGVVLALVDFDFFL